MRARSDDVYTVDNLLKFHMGARIVRAFSVFFSPFLISGGCSSPHFSQYKARSKDIHS